MADRARAEEAFPDPSQRMVVIALDGPGPALTTIRRVSTRLAWPTLTVTDAAQLTWTLTVNNPSLTVVVSDNAASTLAAVETVRKVGKWPIAALRDLSPSETARAFVVGADIVLAPARGDDEIAARVLVFLRRSAEGSEAGARYLISRSLRVDCGVWRLPSTGDHWICPTRSSAS